MLGKSSELGFGARGIETVGRNVEIGRARREREHVRSRLTSTIVIDYTVSIGILLCTLAFSGHKSHWTQIPNSLMQRAALHA